MLLQMTAACVNYFLLMGLDSAANNKIMTKLLFFCFYQWFALFCCCGGNTTPSCFIISTNGCFLKLSKVTEIQLMALQFMLN